ncbi:MAG: aldose epimerase family protein, partial [Chitinophagaceae bacterium]
VSGFDKKTWQYVSSGETPGPFLALKYLSKNGEEGFPGNLEVEIRFELNNEDELSYQYTATCDEPTAVNLTHHSYFNLNNGSGTIHDHELKIYSFEIIDSDEELIPTGKFIPVKDSVFDFTRFQRIGDGLTMIPEYDKSYIADRNGDFASLLLMAEARSLKSNMLLQVYSTEPVVHFYSGKWTPVVKGKNGIFYGPFSGFCLETHKHVNAVNIPYFPNTILRPGEVYFQKTVYKVCQIVEK